MKVNEIENAVYNFINTEPRTRKEIISFVKRYKATSHVTGDKVIKGFLKDGKLSFEIVGKEKIYSIVGDPRLHYIADKIALYDARGSRITRLAQYWNKYEVRNIIEDKEEVSANVKSFTSNNWHSVMIRSNNEVSCSCTGFIYYNLPCVHVLALAINRDKINWLP
jgi:hypothetical protein